MASKVLAESALVSGMDVKQNEVHGMAQRGGSVISFVRIGDQVSSPVVMPGSADLLISFEPLEALRYIHFSQAGWSNGLQQGIHQSQYRCCRVGDLSGRR